MVIENKVAEAADWQARILNLEGSGAQVEPGQERKTVTWPDVIADVMGIVERGLAGGAEAAVLSDFLTYVEDHFAGPPRADLHGARSSLHGGGFGTGEKRLRLLERRLVAHRREELTRRTERRLRFGLANGA
jgi:hypothetical protein